jgi:two-component system NtrC family response regulator
MSGPIRTLIVDDEQIIRDIVADILACEGGAVEAVSVATCAEALQLAQAQEFDVVLLDVCMEDGDGVALLRQFRELRPDARIYMVTGYEVEDQLQQALAEGATGTLRKPFRVNEILEVIYGEAPPPSTLS